MNFSKKQVKAIIGTLLVIFFTLAAFMIYIIATISPEEESSTNISIGYTNTVEEEENQIEGEEYETIKTISITPNSEELSNLMANLWSSSSEFGSRESIFKNYNIYFDEGIETRKINSNIYNIIYTENYDGAVINNLKVGIDLDDVEDYLGVPAFKDEELGVIGYKGGNLYAFFTEDEISIYRCTEYDYDDFWDLCDELLDDELTFKEFMNELTYIWKDYSEYSYDSDYMFISYPNRGVDIKLNYDDVSGIIFYNNMSENLTTLNKYLEDDTFISKLATDNVFEAEKRRIEAKSETLQLCEEFEETIEDEYSDIALLAKQSELFDFYIETDDSGGTIAVYFVSKDGQNANRELTDPVYTYVWVADKYFVYSINSTGIYSLDVTTGTKVTLTEGEDEEYEITSYQNQILTYDGIEMTIEY